MQINVNCKQNEGHAWCKDKRVKRSLFGIGARVCCVSNGDKCPYQDPYPRPNISPPPSPYKKA